MAGTLPLPRPLRTDEVTRFGAVHVCMVMDMAQGMRNFEIAAKYDTGEGMVCNLRCHPWTQMVLQALFLRLADNLTDPMERIKAYANEAINVKAEILLDPKKSATLRNAVASDFLDRAGYGARSKVDVEVSTKKKPAVPSTHLGRIASALEAAASVRQVDFSAFVTKAAPQEDGLAVKDASSEDSAPSEGSGASHAGPPQPQPVVLEEKKLTPEEKELKEEQDAQRNLPPGLHLSRVA